MWVESQPGKGSTFHFIAKFTVVTSPRAFEKTRNLTAVLNGVRVLMVDDQPVNRLVLRELLTGGGAAVDEACDGASALAMLATAHLSTKPYRLLLVDGRMPGMDGFELAECVKAIAYDTLSVMMLTSDDLKTDIARLRKYDVDAHLVKPVRRAELYEAIAIAMRRGRM